MMCYSVMTQAYSEKEIPSSPNRSRTYDLPITSSEFIKGRPSRNQPTGLVQRPRLPSHAKLVLYSIGFLPKMHRPGTQASLFLVPAKYLFQPSSQVHSSEITFNVSRTVRDA